ncbi:unnamed protein product [Angiostrongylus costaricensis]|uniref:Zinc finger, C2H2 type n=1 Tax=Angiostrongylus costaricensis TaxID=334426 RepID=A0A158PDR4_ANGCS|nr:unnamed protein product [Angiostrongylus costaricensis]
MYQCDICQMQFSQKANMHRHRMRHSGVKPYECRYCKKRFFRKDQMQEHSMTHIKTGIAFDCPVAFCSRQFSQSHLDEAHNVCASSPASCKRCSLLFANSRRLLLHYQTRHDDTEVSAKKSSKNVDELPLKRKRPLPSAVSPPYTHLVCKKEFSPHQTDSSEKSSSPDLDQECTHCGISFFDETMHLLHKGLHSECDPWRCNLCGTQCMEKYMFTTHVIFAGHST